MLLTTGFIFMTFVRLLLSFRKEKKNFSPSLVRKTQPRCLRLYIRVIGGLEEGLLPRDWSGRNVTLHLRSTYLGHHRLELG